MTAVRRAFVALIEGPAWRGAALFAAVFLATALPRLSQPGEYVFDEVYQAFTAGRYATGDRDAFSGVVPYGGGCRLCAYEWVHPPLGKLVHAASIRALGDGPIGWRLPGALAGAGLVALTYVVARRVVRVRGAADLAAFALCCDGLLLVMSRTAMSDVFVALFVLATYGAFGRWLDLRAGEPHSPDGPRRARRQLYLVGALAGLAIATKWFGLLAWGWIGLWVGGDAIAGRSRSLRRAAHVGAAMIALPAGIYLASYVPFFAHGYGARDFVELVLQQARYHANLTAQHDYASPWWSWPLALRPVWMWTSTAGGVHRDIYAVGNPVVWWTGLLALLGLARLCLMRRAHGRGDGHAAVVLLLGFFGQWLPWALPRRPAFIYYMLSALPFAAMAAAWAVAGAARRLALAGRRRVLSAALPLGYAAMLAALAVWLYPLWTGLPLNSAGRSVRLLLPGWK